MIPVMIMVVIAHPMYHFISLSSGRAIYYWLNLLMMPAFALVTGYISRNFRATPKEIQRTVSTLVVPYLLIEPLFQVGQLFCGFFQHEDSLSGRTRVRRSQTNRTDYTCNKPRSQSSRRILFSCRFIASASLVERS